LNRLGGIAVVIAKRIVFAAALIIGTTAIIYTTVRMAPGDAVDAVSGMGVSAEVEAKLRSDFGLDRTPFEGYLDWLSKATRGDLGTSFSFGEEPVAKIAGKAFIVTLKLAGYSLLAVVLLALLFAVIMGEPARWQGIITAPLYFISTTPALISSIFLLQGINYYVREYVEDEVANELEWYALGMVSDSSVPLFVAGLALALSDGLFIDCFNGLRARLNSLRRSQFVTAAKARGGSVVRHIARNMWLPIFSSYSARLPTILGGVVVVERIFGIEGAGYALIEAAIARDFPVVVGITAMFTATVVIVDLAAAVLRAIIDPREAAHGA